MPSIEAQRTLVKSPPELWAELSDPASLARHLGEFGEIRIARVEAETSVEWEAESASGTVELKPSGWGTKVTLTVVRDTHQPVAAEPEPEPEPELESEPELQPEPEPEAEPEPTPAVADPPPMFFTRIFRRWRRWRAAVEPDPAALEPGPPLVEPDPAALEPGPPLVEPDPVAVEPVAEEQQPVPDLAAELAAELTRVEAAMAEQDAQLLSAVLDRLGAAHHRPFSRG